MNYYTRYVGPIAVHSLLPRTEISTSINSQTGLFWDALYYITGIQDFNRSLSQNKVSELCIKKKWSF